MGVLDTTLCDTVCQWAAASRWFPPGTPFSSTNKIDRHDITEISLKVALNTINQPTNSFTTFNYHFSIFKYFYGGVILTGDHII
jgi:hypothetical protein